MFEVVLFTVKRTSQVGCCGCRDRGEMGMLAFEPLFVMVMEVLRTMIMGGGSGSALLSCGHAFTFRLCRCR